MSIHAILAGATGLTALELVKPKSEGLATALAGVLRHYPDTLAKYEMPTDWLALFACAGAVYGTMIRDAKQEYRAKRATATPAAPSSGTVPGAAPIDPNNVVPLGRG